MGLLTARPSSTHFVVDHPLFLDVKENPDWKNQFENSHPLKLEIGFGMGDFLIAMARKEPESNFVGIDFSQDCISKLLQSIDSFQFFLCYMEGNLIALSNAHFLTYFQIDQTYRQNQLKKVLES